MNTATLYKAIKRVNYLCATLAGLILLFISISIFIDVFSRYLFNAPSIWITEVSSYLFLYVIFLGTAYALDQGLHIRVTFLRDRFDRSVRKFLDLLTSLLSIAFCAVLLWQTSEMTWSAYSEGWISPTILGVSHYLIYISMVIGSLLLLLTFILRTVVFFCNDEENAN